MPEARTSAVTWRIASAVATLIAAAALAWVIAHWTWRIVAPAPLHLPPAQPVDPAAAIVAGQLFGAPSRGEVAAAAPPTDSLGDMRLLGIVARNDGQGYAVFHAPAGARVVVTGSDVAPGVRLVSVTNDGVTVRDASGERTLELRTPGPRSASSSAARATAPARGANVAPNASRAGPNVASKAQLASNASRCSPPPGFKGEVVRLNVELVGGLISQPEVWRSMVQPSNGALVVRETAGFGPMIGLQQGDRVEQANGIALNVPDDVVGAVLRPLASNQPVHLVGKRNGQPRELWIANASCTG